MLICRDPRSMHAWSRARHAEGQSIACVPTMGALHAGHRALIAEARERGDVVVVSIFVNPLQFNRGDDFDKYPRPLDDDLDACRTAAVDAVYAPDAAAMYPKGFQTHVEPGELAETLEGASRPGHFRGVATVVAKLFGAMQPDVAIFGQKDFQQLAVIRRMVDDLDMAVEIFGISTVREPDGLAISSRNQLLSTDDRHAAVCIVEALQLAAQMLADGERNAEVLVDAATKHVDAEPRARLEYLRIVDVVTLGPVAEVGQPAVVLAAAWFGDVRLIDNLQLSP
ncbi:MAG TPA: pantoate--beta-alanine ligase [Ilumatobacteraceae bacterium]|nr:pantoate--beta-alanine ligase [Ilumatobacteraceae bacterium]